ncbi:MAG: hypothetical protein ACRERC_14740 [Candidatus Binatia bacterium]
MLIAALLTVPMSVLAAPVTTADELCAPAANPCVVSTPVTVVSGSVLDVGARELRIATGGALDVASGAMTLRAALVSIAAGGFVRAVGSASSTGGDLLIDAGEVSIIGSLDASGAPGGSITLLVGGALAVSPTGTIVARSLDRAEIGGGIDITAQTVTISGLVRAPGGTEELGGDITVDSRGDTTISGTLDASGGDAGTIEVEAGFNANQGNLVLTPTAVVLADASAAGGFGGSIDLNAAGDGVSTGLVTLAGKVSVLGRTGSEDIGGGLGGEIAVSATGDVINVHTASRIDADGGAPDGDGGEVEIASDSGAIGLQGTITASAPGAESSAGAVTIDAFSGAVIGGTVLVTAGDGGGGEVAITSAMASVLVSEHGVINAASTSGGLGGTICLESGSGTVGSRSVVVEGSVLADGGSSGGGGGSIELAGGDAVRVAETAMVRANGGPASGQGGSLTVVVNEGPALLDGPLMATGGSPAGPGGIVAVDAQGRISANATITARGFGRGGNIGLSSSGAVEVRSGLLVNSTTAGGGLVEIVSQGTVQLAGTVLADGVAEPGGRIQVTGCEVTLCGLESPACSGTDTGVLSSLGPAGVNRVVGRDASNILGIMRANVATGRNELVYDGDPERAPFFGLGSLTPPATVIVDPNVLPCPACGNRVIDPPETCDDGNEIDGDGCSATCQREAPIPGDANGDFILSDSDVRGLISELFDGDGDSIAMVSGGAFPGGLGADANDDERVTVADIPAIIGLLFAP